MIDLSQVSLALRGATDKSLVILDEFGKGMCHCKYAKPNRELTLGTTPTDGAGLLAGVIEHLISVVCPRTIVLTHFQYAFMRPRHAHHVY
jgi:DNA mismatch repair protein MSH5